MEAKQLSFKVIEINSSVDQLCRKITADLPEYFGIPEANEHYAEGVNKRINFAAQVNNDLVGLLSLEFTYPNNVNIYWMGVMRAYQGSGIGGALIEKAEGYAKNKGATTITVETLAPAECDENYLKTYHFYQRWGFRPLFNLKPSGYEWNMVYMVKSCLKNSNHQNEIHVRQMIEEDSDVLVEAFARHHWDKPKSLFEKYLQEQQEGKRQVWVAFFKDELAGYVTLNWHSSYQPFLTGNIPEIMDLNVLPPYRKRGIGSLLIDHAEKYAAKESPLVGIGVGLYDGYGDAQKLYVKRAIFQTEEGQPINIKTWTMGNLSLSMMI